MTILSLPVGQIIALAVTAVLAYYIIRYITSPLKDIPGPFLAKFTNFWRVYDYYHFISPETQKKLHAKHGLAVRLGPNLVSLNDPTLIPVIYNSRGTFRKVCTSFTPSSSNQGEGATPRKQLRLTAHRQGSFYTVGDALVHGNKVENLFSTRSNQFHLEQLMPIQKFYSIQGVLAYENLIDRAMILLCEQLEARFVDGANADKTCDIADWISYCEFHLWALSNSIHDEICIQKAILTTASFDSCLGSPRRDYME